MGRIANPNERQALILGEDGGMETTGVKAEILHDNIMGSEDKIDRVVGNREGARGDGGLDEGRDHGFVEQFTKAEGRIEGLGAKKQGSRDMGEGEVSIEGSCVPP